MKRKNFLRQMAVTIPVGIAAPKLLFAEQDEKNVIPETLIFISDEHAAATTALSAPYTEVAVSSVASLNYDKGSFLVVDKTGKKMRAGKLVVSGKITLENEMKHVAFTSAPAVTVEFGQRRKSAGALSLYSYQLPQYHVHNAETFREEHLQQFLSRKRAGVLRLV